MEIIDAIYKRHSCRDYIDKRVERPLILEILRAAVHAPTGMDEQPWVFGVFEGQNVLRDYSERAKMHFLNVFGPGHDPHTRHHLALQSPEFNIFYNASTLVVVYAKPAGQFSSVDCCLAAENLMLAAVGLGLATCPIGFAQPWLDLAEVKEELGIPSSYAAVLPIVVGYPGNFPTPTSRREPVVANWQ
jgi:nitroreductase